MSSDQLVVLAGGTGDLGGRIATALGCRQAPFRVLVRVGNPVAKRARLEAAGATVVEVDYNDALAMKERVRRILLCDFPRSLD